jgi:tRNA(fMet)-specific endonuclease VapC
METSPILLDSSILIDFFRKKKKSKSVLFNLIAGHDFYISVITDFEIKIGITTEPHQQDYDILIQNINYLPIDLPCIEKAVELHQYLRENNALIELADLLIAATAMSNSLPLATLNQKHFQRIPALQLAELP